jgi:DNA-directed RNA polymerase specialized sigma24 family protein
MPRYDPWYEFITAYEAWTNAPDDDVQQLAALDRCLTKLQHVRDHDLIEMIGHGHKHAEIAEALGVSRQAVGQQVKYARQRVIAAQQRRKGTK